MLHRTVTAKTFRADGRQRAPDCLRSSPAASFLFCNNLINQINTNLKCNPKPKGSSFLLLQLSPNVVKTSLGEMNMKYMKPPKTSWKQEWLTAYKVYVID